MEKRPAQPNNQKRIRLHKYGFYFDTMSKLFDTKTHVFYHIERKYPKVFEVLLAYTKKHEQEIKDAAQEKQNLNLIPYKSYTLVLGEGGYTLWRDGAILNDKPQTLDACKKDVSNRILGRQRAAKQRSH